MKNTPKTVTPVTELIDHPLAQGNWTKNITPAAIGDVLSAIGVAPSSIAGVPPLPMPRILKDPPDGAVTGYCVPPLERSVTDLPTLNAPVIVLSNGCWVDKLGLELLWIGKLPVIRFNSASIESNVSPLARSFLNSSSAIVPTLLNIA